MTNQEQMLNKREKYLNNEISHEDYYLWLSDFLELPGYLIPFTKDQIKNSKDEHFNDLQLSKWDSKHDSVLNFVRNKGLKSWSLVETVCCLKTMARQWAKD